MERASPAIATTTSEEEEEEGKASKEGECCTMDKTYEGLILGSRRHTGGPKD